MEEVKKEVAEMIEKSVAENVEKQVVKQQEDIDGKISKSIEEVKKSAEEQVKSLQAEIESLKKADAEKTETIKSLGEKMQDNKIPAVKMSQKMKRAIYKEAIKSEIKEHLEEIKALNGTDVKKEYRLETSIEKAAGTVMRANITDGDGNAMYQAYSPIEPGVTRVQLPRMVMRDLANVGTVEGAYARWTEATAGEGNPDAVEEGAAKPQREQEWVLREEKVVKLAVFTKVSEETLEDIEWASEEIAADLVERLLEAEDSYIIGIVSSHGAAFDAGSFTANVVSANMMDAIRVAAAQVASANFYPETVILNPADAAAMDLEKDAVNRYLWVKVDDRVWGLRIVESNNMTAGEFMVGDFSRLNYRIRKDVTMYAGREKDDLTKNLFTIVFELRGVAYIKTPHQGAFSYGEFATAIAAIDKTAEGEE